MNDVVYLLILALPLLEAIVLVSLTYRWRARVLRTLSKSEVAKLEPSDLSLAEVAMLASGGDENKFAEALVAGAVCRIDSGTVAREADSEEMIDFLGKLERDIQSPSKPVLHGLRIISSLTWRILFGRHIQRFVSAYLVDESLSLSNLTYERVVQLVERNKKDPAYLRLRQSAIETLVRRRLIASDETVSKAKKELTDLIRIPVFGTSGLIIVTVFVCMFLATAFQSPVSLGSALAGSLMITVMTSAVFLMWVGASAIPGCFLYLWFSKISPVPSWWTLAWARTELPREDLWTNFLRSLIKLAGLVRPLGNLMLLILVVGPLLRTLIPFNVAELLGVLCTYAAICGWALTFQLRRDIGKLTSKIALTEAGEKELSLVRARLTGSSPLGNLGRSLGPDKYKNELCQLVGVQGADVLWMLDNSSVPKSSNVKAK